MLSVLSLLSPPILSRHFARHLTFLLCLTFAVYGYRDLWPLGTLTLTPLDIMEGPFLWWKITMIFLGGIAIPLFTPRPYVPYNPKVNSYRLSTT